MTDFYSKPIRRSAEPSLRVSSSQAIDRAARSIVVGYRTDASPQVMKEAIAAAERHKAALRVVVYATDTTAAPASGRIDQVKEISLQIIEAGLEFEIQRAGSDVAEQVLDLAAEHHASLIVLATRRRSPVMKLFLGSSAQRVILEAECPVLTVK
ncbi:MULTISPECIES: universal stress protein [Micrococcales]|uniref:universal stress protein n=1 Tax=Micrococcales TaxID=85006 RepID=UPI0004AA2314|nr:MULTISPECIES: universal stress protein [Micrococcales]